MPSRRRTVYACPRCGGDTVIRYTRRRPGCTIRHRECQACATRFRTSQPIEKFEGFDRDSYTSEHRVTAIRTRPSAEP
jgi:hypothetical protein